MLASTPWPGRFGCCFIPRLLAIALIAQAVLLPAAVASPSAPAPAAADRLEAGRRLFQAGRYAEAESAWQAASARAPEDEALWLALGLARLRLERHAEAARAFEAALALAPEDPRASFHLGLARLLAGSDAAAARAFERAAALQPNDPRVIANWGAACFRLGRDVEAERHWREALLLAPDQPEVAFNLGLVLQRRHAPEEAARFFRRAALGRPALKAVAEALQSPAEAARGPEAAQAPEPLRWAAETATLAGAIQAHPEAPGPYVRLAEFFASHGEAPTAEALFRRALALAPGDPARAEAGLADLLVRGDRPQEARAAYERLLARSPGAVAWRVRLGLLDLLLDQPLAAREAARRMFTTGSRPPGAQALFALTADRGQRAEADQAVASLAADRDPSWRAIALRLRALRQTRRAAGPGTIAAIARAALAIETTANHPVPPGAPARPQPQSQAHPQARSTGHSKHPLPAGLPFEDEWPVYHGP